MTFSPHIDPQRLFNVVIRDDEGKPLTVWFETDGEMIAFIHLWDEAQRAQEQLEAAEKRLA